MGFLEIGPYTLHISTTRQSTSFLLITCWPLSSAVLYYKSLAGRGLACSRGYISCLLSCWTSCGFLMIVHWLPLIPRKTDSRRDLSHWFSRQPRMQMGSMAFSGPGKDFLLGVGKMLESPLQPSTWSQSLGTGHGSFSHTHLLADIPHLDVCFDILSWVPTSVL